MNKNKNKILNILFNVLGQIKKQTNHSDYVILGSLSPVGIADEDEKLLSTDMIASPDFDLYLKNDPYRSDNIDNEFGENSNFHKKTGYMVDIVTPDTPNLPKNWIGRLNHIGKDELNAYFLEPNDAAVSKLSRGNDNDIGWIASGLESGLLDAEVISNRLKQVEKLTPEELKKSQILLRNIIFELKLPPLLEDFDWKNGEKDLTDDYSAEFEIKFQQEKYNYLLIIKPFEKNNNKNITIAKEFDDYDTCFLYGKKFKYDEYKNAKIINKNKKLTF